MKTRTNVAILAIFLFGTISSFAQQRTSPHPDAPVELQQFSFIIGNWECDGKSKQQDGSYTEWQATWKGYYNLDGFQIADDFIMTDADGKYTFFGTTYRGYNLAEKKWDIKWYNALQTKWIDIEGEFKNGEMHLLGRGSGAKGDFLTRIKFKEITANSFTWKNDISFDDGKTWTMDNIVVKVKRLN